MSFSDMGFGHRNCVLKGCPGSKKRLRKWASSRCELHACIHSTVNCDCKPPFQLFPFPTALKTINGRITWTGAVKRQDWKGKMWKPTKSSRVCSEHFLHGKPTKERHCSLLMFMKQIAFADRQELSTNGFCPGVPVHKGITIVSFFVWESLVSCFVLFGPLYRLT